MHVSAAVLASGDRGGGVLVWDPYRGRRVAQCVVCIGAAALATLATWLSLVAGAQQFYHRHCLGASSHCLARHKILHIK